MCNKRYISKPQNKEIESVSGKTDSPMSLLSCSPFLWLNSHLERGCSPCLLTCPGFKAHARRSSRRGTFRYSSGTGGPTWMVQIPCLGILLVSHVNQVIQPLFLSYYFLAKFPSGAWVPTKPANFAWASKIGPGEPQCLLSFRRTGRHLRPT